MDHELTEALTTTLDRLANATHLLHVAAERLAEHQLIAADNTLNHITATVELNLEQRLAAAEALITELRASAPVAVTNTGRKTLPTTILAKQGVLVEGMEAGALDAALHSLSLEQRIAVKAQLLRSGLLG